MKINIKNIIFAIIALAISVVLYNWYINCWKDHSKLSRAIGIPMQDNVQAFYKEHQRYPSFEETRDILEKVGCSNIKRTGYSEFKMKGIVYTESTYYNCTFDSTEIYFGVTIGDMSVEKTYAEPYSFGFGKGNTRCMIDFEDGGQASGSKVYRCYQDSCLLKGWGH